MNEDDASKLTVMFSLALCSTLPPPIVQHIASQLDEIGRMAKNGGDTTAGNAAISLAKKLAELPGKS